MRSYQEALAFLGHRQRRKLANNTYVRYADADLRGHCIAVRLHNTDIIVYYADGSVVVSTGGWDTVTTRERIRRFSPIEVYRERGVSYWKWWLENRPESSRYRRTFHGTLTLEGFGAPAEAPAAERVLFDVL